MFAENDTAGADGAGRVVFFTGHLASCPGPIKIKNDFQNSLTRQITREKYPDIVAPQDKHSTNADIRVGGCTWRGIVMTTLPVTFLGHRIALLVIAFALLLPGTAAADTNSLVVGFGGSFSHISGATGAVGGSFTLEQFAIQQGQLVGSGEAALSLCVLGVDPKNCLASISQDIALRVAEIAGTCDHLMITLAPIDITDPSLPGYTLHIPALVFDFAPDSALPSEYNRLLCVIAHRSTGGAPLWTYASSLNKLINLL
jgi:hypothetical protein